MEQRRLEVAIEREVQLVVQRADPVAGGDRLRDVREPAPVGVELEALGEQRRELVAGNAADSWAQHGHEAAGSEGSDHLVVVILERGRGHPNERPLLTEDRAVQGLELRPWFDPELLDECPARIVIGRERLGLAAAPVEREHQLTPEPLAQRLRADERLELRDELGVRPKLEIGGNPLLEHAQAQVLEPLDLRLRERLQLEIGERRTSPEPERLAEQQRLLLAARPRAPRRTSRSKRVRSSWSGSSSST